MPHITTKQWAGVRAVEGHLRHLQMRLVAFPQSATVQTRSGPSVLIVTKKTKCRLTLTELRVQPPPGFKPC
jgi:hypothetical protein